MINNFWKGKKVLVTGGAGFIGSYLVEKLVRLEANVSILDNLQNGSVDNLNGADGNYTFVKGIENRSY